MRDSTLNKIISIVRDYLYEEGMSVSAAPTNSTNPPNQINIAGLPPDQPLMFRGKNKNIFLGKGSRKNWLRSRNTPQM